MKSHASMNRIYRLVWNTALNLWVAVAENAKGRSKGGSARGSVQWDDVQAEGGHGVDGGGAGFRLNTACRAGLVLLTSLAVLTHEAHAADAANASVAAGSGSVSTLGNTTTINQASQRLAIDWTSLSTAANEALRFNQPNASAIALNRITGSSPSELLGSLTANGQVFILNPNGVLFGAGSQVNVGGLVASTLSMSNADFMAGNNVFTGSGGSVVNQGTLNAGQGGYLALLAPEVRNEGVMTASLGTALLAAGNKITLNLDNGSLLGYSIDQGAINALAENKQLIKADGGQVLLGAKALDSLTTGTVNNTGVIEAKTIANKAGRIMLIGDMEHGMVNIGGSLDASAPDGGDGGFIETSAAHFKILPGLRVNTLAPQGKTGTWLLDPATMTIAGGTGGAADTIYEDTIEAMGSDVVIEATDSVNVTGTFSNADVEVASGLNLTIRTTGPTGTGIDLTGSTHGAGLTFKVSGGGSASVTTAAATQAIKASAISVTGGAGTINLNSAGGLDVSNTVLQTSGGAISLTAAGQAGSSGVLVSQSTLNAGTGSLTISGTTADTAQYGVLLDRAALTSGNANINSASSAIKLAGSSLTSTGNITIDASNAMTTHHAVELVNAGATQTNVRVNGGGTINITGNLKSGGGSATGGSAGGVVITDSNVTGGSGAVTVNGDVLLPILAGQVSRGVRLDSLAKITGAGNIDITGRLAFGLLTGSAGVELGTGSEVSSTGGNVTATGRGVAANGVTESYGLIARGKVQSGTFRSVTLDGSSSLNASGISGSGVLIDAGADIIAGRLGFNSTGIFGSSSGGTPTINGISMVGGSINSTGSVTMIGSLGGVSSMGGGHAVSLTGGSINSNTAAMTLRGMNFPTGAIAPAGSYALNIDGTSITSGGGAITLLGDRINIGSAVNAGAGKVLVNTDIFSANQPITLGGASETAAMNLSNAELNRITASVIAIGSTSNTGGIVIGNTGGAINLASAPSLSLINSNAAGSGISQTAAFTVANLNADARTVILDNPLNQISQVSGRAYGTNNFQVRSNSALSVGTVDGTAGITQSGTGLVALQSRGALSQTQAIVANTLQATSFGGMTLANAGNQIQNFDRLHNSTSGDITLRNTAATASFQGGFHSAGRVDIANTGNILMVGSYMPFLSNATGTTAGTAGFSMVATGGISTQTVQTNINPLSGGSVYLEAGNGSIGASTAGPITIYTTGPVVAVASGAGSQVNLDLAYGGTLENVSATGAVNVTAAFALAVKTVSGSSVTLSSSLGAILDANGAANNITSTTLNATARESITLGTNVTGLQTLATTEPGAAGDINLTAANALSTSNLAITTDAGSAQTVSVTSAAGITVDSAFGNSQDKFKFTTAAGNIAVNAALTAGQLTLSTGGASTQTAGITANGLELLGTGSHTLTNAANSVTTLAGNTGDVAYEQAGALTVGTVNTAGLTASGKVLVRTTGAASDLTLANSVTSGSAANDSLVLAAGQNFVNNAGAGALNPGAGRFLVYSTDPTASNLGGLVSTGNAFGRTYAANAPSHGSMTSLTGNRFVYSFVPTLNVSGDNQSKAYGGADPALTYTVSSGLVAGDTAASALSGSLSAPTGAATTGPTHAITQGTLASALGYNVVYTNGTLTMTGVPPLPASLFGVTSALDGPYVTAINTIAGTDKPLGSSTDSESTVLDDAPLIKALNAAAAEAAGQDGGE
ncbi:two-partner secretion domain-containing protein [Polaromonas sp. LjRoot131]|uniref:two-partner secretion domain-containing protein n=1 Tax=Polaromonas sp. LjRoot131 TaxID=3342262 RepID=UPI003ED030C7